MEEENIIYHTDYQNIYNYNNYNKILLLLFLIYLCIYFLIIIKKYN